MNGWVGGIRRDGRREDDLGQVTGVLLSSEVPKAIEEEKERAGRLRGMVGSGWVRGVTGLAGRSWCGNYFERARAGLRALFEAVEPGNVPGMPFRPSPA